MYGMDEEPIKIFRTTLKTVIKNLSELNDVAVENLSEAVEEGYAGYNYDGEDEVILHDTWPDISKDGQYQLRSKVDHENAYEFTLHIAVDNGKASITNVL